MSSSATGDFRAIAARNDGKDAAGAYWNSSPTERPS